MRWRLERLLRHARVCVEEAMPAGSDSAKAAMPQCAERLFPRMLDCEKMIDVEDERVGAI